MNRHRITTEVVISGRVLVEIQFRLPTSSAYGTDCISIFSSAVLGHIEVVRYTPGWCGVSNGLQSVILNFARSSSMYSIWLMKMVPLVLSRWMCIPKILDGSPRSETSHLSEN